MRHLLLQIPLQRLNLLFQVLHLNGTIMIPIKRSHQSLVVPANPHWFPHESNGYKALFTFNVFFDLCRQKQTLSMHTWLPSFAAIGPILEVWRKRLFTRIVCVCVKRQEYGLIATGDGVWCKVRLKPFVLLPNWMKKLIYNDIKYSPVCTFVGVRTGSSSVHPPVVYISVPSHSCVPSSSCPAESPVRRFQYIYTQIE